MWRNKKIDRCHNISMLQDQAKAVLPRPIFDYIDGGAEDEHALRGSCDAYDNYQFLPNMLTDVSALTTEVELFGCKIPWPLMLSPTGLTRMFHSGAEIAVAAAAGQAGLPYCLSTLGTTTIEEFGPAAIGPKLFQVYIFKDRGLTAEFVERAQAADMDGLVLTVDTIVAGKRERDLKNGLSLPPRLTAKSFLSFVMKPDWSLPVLFGRKFDFVNVSHRVDTLSKDMTSLYTYVDGQFDRTVTWKDVEWLASIWKGPLAIKGILTPEDACRARDAGADTIMVSNHGGRQLDSVVAPIDQIARIADLVKGDVKIICDGGIRRGSHIVKALAMGADACSIGRPYLYGLAAGGEKGVVKSIDILKEEFLLTMRLSGVSDVVDLNQDLLGRRASGIV